MTCRNVRPPRSSSLLWSGAESGWTVRERSQTSASRGPPGGLVPRALASARPAAQRHVRGCGTEGAPACPMPGTARPSEVSLPAGARERPGGCSGTAPTGARRTRSRPPSPSVSRSAWSPGSGASSRGRGSGRRNGRHRPGPRRRGLDPERPGAEAGDRRGHGHGRSGGPGRRRRSAAAGSGGASAPAPRALAGRCDRPLNRGKGGAS